MSLLRGMFFFSQQKQAKHLPDSQRSSSCVPVVIYAAMDHVIHPGVRADSTHHTTDLTDLTDLTNRANIVHIVIHVVWCVFQKFVFATFAIEDTGNVVTSKLRNSIGDLDCIWRPLAQRIATFRTTHLK